MNENTKPDGGPAFPYEEHNGDGTIYNDHFGMTLRDYFAAKALAALIANPCKDDVKRGAAGVPILAGYAYEYADAMIAARRPNQPLKD